MSKEEVLKLLQFINLEMNEINENNLKSIKKSPYGVSNTTMTSILIFNYLTDLSKRVMVDWSEYINNEN